MSNKTELLNEISHQIASSYLLELLIRLLSYL